MAGTVPGMVLPVVGTEPGTAPRPQLVLGKVWGMVSLPPLPVVGKVWGMVSLPLAWGMASQALGRASGMASPLLGRAWGMAWGTESQYLPSGKVLGMASHQVSGMVLGMVWQAESGDKLGMV